MDKKAIRQRLLRQRKQLTALTCRTLSQKIQQNLVAADCFSCSRTLALYSPINNEVRTDLLFLTARNDGKRVCFPRVCGERLQFVLVDSAEDLSAGTFGVCEPVAGALVAAEEIDLLVVPGVAFDRSGHRLGYGKGFYDRELAACADSVSAVGLGYEFQLCQRLPAEEHDQPLDFIATETALIPCRKEATG